MLELRALEPSDVDCLYIWENNPDMWRYGFAPAPLSRHRLWEYIRSYVADPASEGQLRLMIEADGVPVGTVDLYDIDVHNSHAFIGIMIAPPYRRRGYAAAAIGKMADYCRQCLALKQLGAFVAADNKESLGLFRKCGFMEKAILPQWVRRSNSEYENAYFMTRSLD